MLSNIQSYILPLATAFAVVVGANVPANAGEPVLGYTTYGTGPEKVIVLHNWMGDQSTFDDTRRYIDAEKFTYVFADVRGYGKSIDMQGDYNSTEIAGDIFRLADELGWDRFHLVGHSMNGQAVQRAALIDWQSGNRRIENIVAVTPVIADSYPADEETAKFLMDLIQNPEMSAMGFSALTGGKLNTSWVQFMTERHLETSRGDAMRGYYDMWLNEDFSAEIEAAGIETPILVIGGRNDLPGFQEDVLRAGFEPRYKNVSFAFIENAGHFPMIETPALYTSLVEAHILGGTRIPGEDQ